MNKRVLLLVVLILTLSIALAGCLTYEPEEQNTDVKTENQNAETKDMSEGPEEDINETVENDSADNNAEVAENELGKLTVVNKNESVNMTQESGPFKITVNKVQVATLEVDPDYQDMFENKDIVTVITLEIKVENKSTETNSIYPDQAIIVTNTKEQVEADLFFSDDVGGDFIGEVIKEGDVIFILDSPAEEITSFKYIIDGPHDEDFETIGEDITFELSF